LLPRVRGLVRVPGLVPGQVRGQVRGPGQVRVLGTQARERAEGTQARVRAQVLAEHFVSR